MQAGLPKIFKISFNALNKNFNLNFHEITVNEGDIWLLDPITKQPFKYTNSKKLVKQFNFP